ncbi:thiamine phosphate synthase [Paenibacillus thailandensis]|uniref:Thiamine-phosphate synthase n=1 Tax=Paenibacillus thailandensis TaxID=393250 RepID=A0ABW5QSZ9_9BACL
MGNWNWDNIRLYVITGENYHPGRAMLDVIEQALQGGADIVQLRDKTADKDELLRKARSLKELTRHFGVPLIVNDYPDIAKLADADGVHLGQEDGGFAEARELLGPDKIVGVSTHSIGQALAAQEAGADYIGVGPVYPTGTKPGRQAVTTAYVREAAAGVRIPFFAIGGITPANAAEVLAAGAARLCAVSAIVGSDNPRRVCEAFKAQLTAAGEHGGAAVRRIQLNGAERTVAAATVEELVLQLGQQGKRLLVELDGAIVDRSVWPEAPIREGASVELIHFVGGG